MFFMKVDDASEKISTIKQPVPFLKWAGGKRWFALRHIDMVPTRYSRYIEPFLGSGAMFFALQPQIAILSDINSDLINCFQAICENPEGITMQLAQYHGAHCMEYYYHTRSSKPIDPIERAAWFIYLNRTCWNGLYRVNRNNEFNVPIGSKKNVLLPTDDFTGIKKCCCAQKYYAGTSKIRWTMQVQRILCLWIRHTQSNIILMDS